MNELLDELLKAIKSEIEAQKLYKKMAEMAKNFLLKDKLNYIANEESKHQLLLENVLKEYTDENFDYEKIKTELINKTFSFTESDDLSQLFLKAMDFEKESAEFYGKQIGKYSDPKLDEFFNYLSILEESHYFLFEKEYNFFKENENFEDDNTLFNIGP